MNSLDVTVIVPVKDGVQYIVESLESALNQSNPPSAVIVVDDGSSDGTKELVTKEFGSRVQIVDGPSQGAGPARNVGVQYAKTKLVAFLDADDYWHPQKLARQLEVFEPGTLLGTYSNYFVSFPNGRRFLGTSIRTETNEEADRLIATGEGLPILLSSWLFEKDSFIELGGFDKEYLYAQDFEIALRYSKKGIPFKVLRESLVDYRIHASSETYQNYIMQTKFAEYSKYKLVGRGELDLESWTTVSWSKAKIRRARAGFYFRLGLASLGNTVPIRAFFLLLLSFTLDPRGFFRKLIRQADLKLSLGIKKP